MMMNYRRDCGDAVIINLYLLSLLGCYAYICYLIAYNLVCLFLVYIMCRWLSETVLRFWLPSEELLLAYMRGLFWFEFVSTYQTFTKVWPEIVRSAIYRKGALLGEGIDENFKAANNPLKLLQPLYQAFNHTVQRHILHGVRRVEAVSWAFGCGVGFGC
jgi:hypothetical protein